MNHALDPQPGMRPWVRDALVAVSIGILAGIILASLYFAFVGGR